MKLTQYIVTKGVCFISGGLVRLSDDQARRRAHNLTALDDAPGVYQVGGTGRHADDRPQLNFKQGETFGHDGDLSKVPGVEAVDPDAEPVDEPADEPQDQPIDEPVDYDGMDKNAAKAELDHRGIDYTTRMKLADLINLLKGSD